MLGKLDTDGTALAEGALEFVTVGGAEIDGDELTDGNTLGFDDFVGTLLVDGDEEFS